MEILTRVKGWAGALTEVGVSLLSLGIILEVLFNGQNIPFWPNIILSVIYKILLQAFQHRA